MIKILKLKLMIVWQYANIKAFLQNVTLQIGLKNFTLAIKVVLGTNVISNPNCEETSGTVYEKELQKASKTNFRFKKVTKKKGNELYVKLKGYNNSINSCIDKKDIVILNEPIFSLTTWTFLYKYEC